MIQTQQKKHYKKSANVRCKIDVFKFIGKTLFEDVPELLFDKMPRDTEKIIDNVSDAIDKFLDN